MQPRYELHKVVTAQRPPKFIWRDLLYKLPFINREIAWFCSAPAIHAELEEAGCPKLTTKSGIPSSSITYSILLGRTIFNATGVPSYLRFLSIFNMENINSLFVSNLQADLSNFIPKDCLLQYPNGKLWAHKPRGLVPYRQSSTEAGELVHICLGLRRDVYDAYLVLNHNIVLKTFPKNKLLNVFTSLQMSRLQNPPPNLRNVKITEFFQFLTTNSASLLQSADILDVLKVLKVVLKHTSLEEEQDPYEGRGGHWSCFHPLRNLISEETTHASAFEWNVIKLIRTSICDDDFLPSNQASDSKLSALANFIIKNVTENYNSTFNPSECALKDWRSPAFRKFVLNTKDIIDLLPHCEQVTVYKALLMLGDSFFCYEILNGLATAAYQIGFYEEASALAFTCSYLGIPSLELGGIKHRQTKNKKNEFNLAAIRFDADLAVLCYYMRKLEDRLLTTYNPNDTEVARKYFRLVKREALFFSPFAKVNLNPHRRHEPHLEVQLPDNLRAIIGGLHSTQFCNSNQRYQSYVHCEKPHFEGSLGLLSDACELLRMELEASLPGSPQPNTVQLAKRLDLIEILTTANIEYLQETLSFVPTKKSTISYFTEQLPTAEIEEIKYNTISSVQTSLAGLSSQILRWNDSDERTYLLWQFDEIMRNKSIVPSGTDRNANMKQLALTETHGSGLGFTEKLFGIAFDDSSVLHKPVSQTGIEILQSLLRNFQLHIQFWSSGGKLYCTVISPLSEQHINITHDLGEVTKYKRLRDEIQDSIHAGDHCEETLDEVQLALSELGNSLISPILTGSGVNLSTLSDISISECSELHGLPWAAVVFDGKPLVNKFQVSVVPSTKYLVHSSQRMIDGTSAEYHMLHLADAEHSQLPGVEKESNFLRNKFARRYTTASNPKKLFNTFAKKRSGQRLRNDILHVSGHGHLDGANPFDSLFSLAPDIQIPTKLFNRFDLSSLMLVFLNTCESGRTKVRPGNDFIGLQFPFIRKGIPNVIQTLFPVDDLFANQFSDKFYSILLSGKRPVEAFRETQLHFQEHDTEDKSALPRWAAYQICGSR